MIIIIALLNAAAWHWLFSEVFYPGFRNYAPIWAQLLGIVGCFVTISICVGVLQDVFHVDVLGGKP